MLERYECLTDDYVFVRKGETVDIKDGVATGKDGDTLDIDIEALRKSADFQLVASGEASPKSPNAVKATGAKYAIATKINRLFDTAEEAKIAATEADAEQCYVMKVIGKVRVIKNIQYEDMEDKA